MSDHAKASSSGSTPRQATRLGRAIRGAFATRGASRRAKGSGAPAGRLLVLAAAILAIAAVLGVASASAVAPVVTVENASEVASTTAKVKGTVDSSGQSTNWRFQVATQADFSDAVDGPAGNIDEGTATVKGKFTGLQPATTYHLRLVAENADGENVEEAAGTFETEAVSAPTVTNVKSSAVEFTRAKASAGVSLAGEDPGFDASCRFEYVTQSEWEANADAFPDGGPSTPCEPATVEAAGPNPVGVKAQLAGLTPGTTYHLRAVAANLGGETRVEAGSTFTTGTVAPPTVENLEVSAVTGTSAHFSAEVNPGAPGASEQDPAFDVTWHFECTPSCHGLKGGSIAGDNAAHTVENDVDQLEPNSTSPGYTVWIVAVNGLGQSSQAFKAFTTPGAGPTVRAFAAGPVASDQASINGEVNPRNSPTTYWFEWGTSDCSANPCAQTQHLPAGTNELQEVAIEATAGQFALTFDGDTTPDLAFDASAAQVQAALQALPSIGAGNATVSGGRIAATGTTGYRVTFIGDLALTDVASLVAADGAAPLTKNKGAEPGSAVVNVLRQGNDSGPYFLYATEHLTGLAPNTTYHFRLVAENASGTTEGDDEQFTTAAVPSSGCSNAAQRAETDSTDLPDCRAYEMVSPPSKSGQDVIQQTGKTHVTPDGNGVTFSALGGFGSLQGTSFDAEYLSRRTGAPGTNGWATRGINPPGGSDTFYAVSFGNTPTYVNAFTPDLSAAIYLSWRPLTDAQNVVGVSNLYRIDGLGGSAPSAELVTSASGPLPNWPATSLLTHSPKIAGVSTGLSHVAFESKLNLTADAPPYSPICAFFQGYLGCLPRLYENVGGTTRLVGRIPSAPDISCDDVNGPACVAAASSQAGVSATLSRYSARMVSDDGRRIFFQVPALADSGAIYMREDGVRTAQLAQNGQLWTASADGSRAFFTTGESLLAADTDTNPDLYMYDANAAAGDHLTLVSASTVNDGTMETVVGASDDGHYVYFVADGQLVAGEPAADVMGLYVWHDGDLTYIGRLLDLNEARLNGPFTEWNYLNSMSTARVTPDGRHLLFTTRSDAGFRGREGFDGYDHAGYQELYLYDADANRLACASCNPSGSPATTDALTNLREGVAVSQFTSDLSRVVSDDGRQVFFTTAEPLVSEDINGRADAYEYDASSRTVHLLSSGTDPSPSYLIDVSNDGTNAFFATRERLLGWDVDGSYDLYDARVSGGLPEPPAVHAPCEGNSCLSPTGSNPPVASTASRAAGPGNAPRRCPRGTRRTREHGKVRCAKKKSKHHRRTEKRTANTDRRAAK